MYPDSSPVAARKALPWNPEMDRVGMENGWLVLYKNL